MNGAFVKHRPLFRIFIMKLLTNLTGGKKSANWLLMLVFALFFSTQMPAIAAVLIWPTHIFIDSKEKAAAMWLENRGNTLQTYQMRIYAWSHNGNEEELTEQDNIVGSPPIMQIEPAKRQLVRLIRTNTPPPGKELTYRVILDEIPPAEPQTQDKANGIQFRMRYSVPVFVFGEGLSAQSMQGSGKIEADKAVIENSLSWRIKNSKKQKTLEVRNNGPVHVHLRNLTFAKTNETKTDPAGAAGYVLPGKTMSWPVTAKMGSGSTLLGIINGKQLVRINAANVEEAD